MSESTEPAKDEVEVSSTADEVPEYERPLLLVCAICGAGPLALPLVWRHPRISWFWKLFITIVVGLITWFCIWLTRVLLVILWEQWQLVRVAFA